MAIERKRAETALRQSEERYRALYEENPSMYFTLGPGGTVVSLNRFGAEQLGYTVEELVGEPVSRSSTRTTDTLFWASYRCCRVLRMSRI
jgi:PAS domain-containing protein